MLIGEKRGAADDEQFDQLRRRDAPAVFVVDGSLRIICCRVDPLERRREYLPDGKTLPSVVRRAVVELIRLRAQSEDAPDSIATVADGALTVRVVWMVGDVPALTVIVERLKTRNYLRAVERRFNLSQRERQVLRLVLSGGTNHEIAAELQIAESTAVFHVKRLLVKMEARNRTELVAKIIG